MQGGGGPGTALDRAMIRKAIKVALIGLAVVVVVLFLTFPTASLVRSVLATVPVPAGRALTFQHARLRPWGLTLDGLAYRRHDGSALVEAEWIRLRPSWTSLGADGFGNPWGLTARVFGGDLEAQFDTGPGADTVDVTWTDLDIGGLLAVLERDVPVSGRFTGRAALKVPRAEPPSGEGEVSVRAASWKLPFPRLAAVRLHADEGTLLWALADRRLEVTRLALRGDEVDMSVQGFIRIAPEPMRSALSLRVTIAPMDDAPPELLELLDELPQRDDGVADFRLTGTLDAPRAVAVRP